MERRTRSTKLAPAGFVVEHAEIDSDCVFLDVRAAAISAACPSCGARSRRTQSRYLRQAADLPIAGRRVVLRVTVRRFWCDAVLCRRRIFAERFGDRVLAPLSRRTGRLETIVHHLGLALGGRPTATFADRLMLPVSNDTLLRVVRRRTEQPRDQLAIIGIDDFAIRRGQRYGTIVCDLERRKPVTLLPDREQATSQAWLLDHPSITTVARDRGGCYGEAIAKALPHADQVADHWHLMENASRVFLDAVGKSMRQIRKAVGSTIVDPRLLTYAERLQYEGYLRRQETNEAILKLSKQSISIKQIVKRTGHSRKLVRSVLRGQRSDVFRVRQSSLEEWLPWLDGRWAQGARNASALWREMREKGFRGQIGVVALEEAIAGHGRPDIFNTDQGSQFTSFAFTTTLKDAGIRISTDGRGRWMDNVFIERLWRSLKYECVFLSAFETGSEARNGIGSWIDYYNRRRPHSTFSGRTPDEVYSTAEMTEQLAA